MSCFSRPEARDAQPSEDFHFQEVSSYKLQYLMVIQFVSRG